jgi:hypothetical protein
MMPPIGCCNSRAVGEFRGSGVRTQWEPRVKAEEAPESASVQDAGVAALVAVTQRQRRSANKAPTPARGGFAPAYLIVLPYRICPRRPPTLAALNLYFHVETGMPGSPPSAESADGVHGSVGDRSSSLNLKQWKRFMQCSNCEVLQVNVARIVAGRGRLAFPRVGRLALLHCERCGTPLAPPDATESLLAKLSQLASFGLSAGGKPILTQEAVAGGTSGVEDE